MNDIRLHLVFFGLAIALCACTQNIPFGMGAPILDSHFGEAVTRARAMQTINPEGATVNDEGYSGKAVHNAMDKYERASPAAASPQGIHITPGAPGTEGTPLK
jgi:hypothetical protein